MDNFVLVLSFRHFEYMKESSISFMLQKEQQNVFSFIEVVKTITFLLFSLRCNKFYNPVIVVVVVPIV